MTPNDGMVRLYNNHWQNRAPLQESPDGKARFVAAPKPEPTKERRATNTCTSLNRPDARFVSFAHATEASLAAPCQTAHTTRLPRQCSTRRHCRHGRRARWQRLSTCQRRGRTRSACATPGAQRRATRALGRKGSSRHVSHSNLCPRPVQSCCRTFRGTNVCCLRLAVAMLLVMWTANAVTLMYHNPSLSDHRRH